MPANEITKWLITGGAGFIGSAMIRDLHLNSSNVIVNVDKLTYAGSLENLASVQTGTRYRHINADINDFANIRKIVLDFEPDVVMHFAAESHVDKSIDSAQVFVKTNIIGTFNLLEVCRDYLNGLDDVRRKAFRFQHISTDEVYGDLAPDEAAFTEQTPYSPSSPYSASKASSDHLVRAWHRTYGLPVLISNCSNNYGPFQLPDKLIPLTIYNALQGRPLPIYGDGQQIRDWLFVDDHVSALKQVATQGKVGETYNIGGDNQLTNLALVELICLLLDDLSPPAHLDIDNYAQLIEFVADRPGHDRRYAINNQKICQQLGWQPKESFQSGLTNTIQWYLDNLSWCQNRLKATDLSNTDKAKI